MPVQRPFACSALSWGQLGARLSHRKQIISKPIDLRAETCFVPQPDPRETSPDGGDKIFGVHVHNERCWQTSLL